MRSETLRYQLKVIMQTAKAVDTKPAIFEHCGNVTNETILSNISNNAARPLETVEFKKVCVCGSGPSLSYSLEKIKKRIEMGFKIAAVNGSYKWLVSKGIIPDYFFMVDAREDLNLSFLSNLQKDTVHIIASQCHPQIFEALKGYKVQLWQVDNYEGAGDLIRKLSPKATILGGASNVGQSCLNALFVMGFRIIHLFGFDGPVRSDEPLETKPAQHAFDQPQNAGEELREWFFEGERFIGTGTNAHDALMFVDRYKTFKKLGLDIQVFGDNLLQKMARSTKSSSTTNRSVPPPKPRKRPVEKLQIVTWKWNGHIPYAADHVNKIANGFDRWLKTPHEVVCITDDPTGIDGSVRTIPLWRDQFEYGRDWHRVKIFSEEMEDLIGPRFVSVDLDTILVGPLDVLFDHDHPFKAWQDPLRPHQYCTALFQMDAGAYPHIWEQFDPKFAMNLRLSGKYNGYDQAWVSYALPGAPVWTAMDGVLSFKRDIIGGDELPGFADIPSNSRLITFHGKYDPSQKDVQKACPWIVEAWK